MSRTRSFRAATEEQRSLKVNVDLKEDCPFCTCDSDSDQSWKGRTRGRTGTMNHVTLPSRAMYSSTPTANRDSHDFFADSPGLSTIKYSKFKQHVKLCSLFVFLVLIASVCALIIWNLGNKFHDNNVTSTELQILRPLPIDEQVRMNIREMEPPWTESLFVNKSSASVELTVVDGVKDIIVLKEFTLLGPSPSDEQVQMNIRAVEPPPKPEILFVNKSSASNEITLVDGIKDIIISMGFSRLDFASEAMGGEIISTPDTVDYYDPNNPHFLLRLFMWARKIVVGKPVNVIRPSMKLSHCWAFRGSRGSVVIQLANFINVRAVSIEHVPSYRTPNNKTLSAPKEFVVYGVFGDGKETQIGHFEYSVPGRLLQVFNTAPGEFDRVRLEVKSNHGLLDYTCVYKFQVHGTRCL